MPRRTRTLNSFVLTSFGLAIFGLVMLFSISVPLSQQNFGENYYYFRHQLIYGFGLGIILFLIARYVPIKLLQKLSPFLLFVAVGLLALVFVPGFGIRQGGSRSWIDASIFTFQPAEGAKLALIVFIAAWLDKHRASIIKKSSTLVHFLLISGLVIVPIVLQPDYGTAAVVAAIAVIIYFVAGARAKALLIV